MRKRMFVGISISRDLKLKVGSWVSNNLKNLKLRITPSKNLHITLIPPWNEENIQEISRKLENIKETTEPFGIEFEKVCFGPTQRRPRLVWVEGKSSRNLVMFKKTLEEILDKKDNRRSFLPHLTLARFRTKDFHRFPFKSLNERVDWKEKVKNICFYESKTLPTGVVYTILKRVKL